MSISSILWTVGFSASSRVTPILWLCKQSKQSMETSDFLSIDRPNEVTSSTNIKLSGWKTGGSGTVMQAREFWWLTDGFKRWPQLRVDGLQQVVIIEIQNELFKVLKAFHVGWGAVPFIQVLLGGAEASLGAKMMLGTVVIDGVFLLGTPSLLVLLRPEICHLHSR